MVFLGHGMSIDFYHVASLAPEIYGAQSKRDVDIACKLQETLERHEREQDASSP